MIQGLLSQVRLTWALMKDPDVPVWTKAIPVAAVLYILSPVDIIPDFLPGLGQLDDLGILLAAMRLMESVAPNNVVRHHRKK